MLEWERRDNTMPHKYTNEYFFERLKHIRQVMQMLKTYRTIKEMMSAQEMASEMNRVNSRQGLEK
ncbi:MAG: hypothetical protein IJ660_00065 [Alphaproteobacteria bacterium]|nr:hypothetical protein [Alphaproteobacteria bacterium]